MCACFDNTLSEEIVMTVKISFRNAWSGSDERAEISFRIARGGSDDMNELN